MSVRGGRITSIPIGTFYTGSFDYLFFASDDDAGAGRCRFANVVFIDSEPPFRLLLMVRLISRGVDGGVVWRCQDAGLV